METVLLVVLSTVASYAQEAYQYAIPEIVSYHRYEVISYFVLSGAWAIPALICSFAAYLNYKRVYKPVWDKAKKDRYAMRDADVIPFICLVVGSVALGLTAFGCLIAGLADIAALFAPEGKAILDLLQ